MNPGAVAVGVLTGDPAPARVSPPESGSAPPPASVNDDRVGRAVPSFAAAAWLIELIVFIGFI